MGLRLSPSVIHRYFYEKSIRFPRGAGSAISIRLTPLLESLLEQIHSVALSRRKEKNGYRRFQGRYELLHPNPEDYDEAARIVTKRTHMYIKENSFNKLGGEQRGETKQPSEPSESTDP